MSYCYATPTQVYNKPTNGTIAATRLTDGSKISVLVDRRNGDDEDCIARTTVATVTNLRKSTSGRYIHFDIKEYNTDESCELNATDYIKIG